MSSSRPTRRSRRERQVQVRQPREDDRPPLGARLHRPGIPGLSDRGRAVIHEPLTEDEEEFMRIVNHRMQAAYSSALGHSPRAYEISDEIGRGLRHAVHHALREMGMRS